LLPSFLGSERDLPSGNRARQVLNSLDREEPMPTYIMLSSWTDQGIRHVKDSPDRLDAARQLCRQHGAEMTGFYMTMGAYDMVVIIDAPSDEAFARLAISIAKGGNIRTATLKAFDEGQYRKIIESIG
jgi:uncharacterized protein with GYD domain